MKVGNLPATELTKPVHQSCLASHAPQTTNPRKLFLHSDQIPIGLYVTPTERLVPITLCPVV